MKKRPTGKQIDSAARALYKYAGWDRPWRKITKEGRDRWRASVRIVIEALNKS